MVNLYICGRQELIDFSDKNISHLISVIDPNESLVPTPNWPSIINHTHFKFDDVEVLMDGAPLRKDVEQIIYHLNDIIAYSNENDVNLLVQCFAGIARSTSIAFMFICMLHDDWPEEKSWEHITMLRPCAWGNRRMVQFADNILAKGGTMIGALKKFQLENSDAEGGLWIPSPIGYQRKF